VSEPGMPLWRRENVAAVLLFLLLLALAVFLRDKPQPFLYRGF